jgi:hypothetical protein
LYRPPPLYWAEFPEIVELMMLVVPAVLSTPPPYKAELAEMVELVIVTVPLL